MPEEKGEPNEKIRKVAIKKRRSPRTPKNELQKNINFHK